MRLRTIVRNLDLAYDHKAWHGPTLRGSLRGVSAAAAAWRPAPGRHNIWEIAVHAAYWKYAVLRKITGARRGSFPLPGSNWFPRPREASERAWRQELRLLDQTHALLRAALLRLPESQLSRKPPAGKTVFEDLLLGIAAHDLYHAGQIQFLKRLWKNR